MIAIFAENGKFGRFFVEVASEGSHIFKTTWRAITHNVHSAIREGCGVAKVEEGVWVT